MTRWPTVRRLLCAVVGVVAIYYMVTPPAHADLGGSVPSPGNCDYPAVGFWGLEGPGVYHWVCDFPTEVNGSHHHCQYGGAATTVTLGVSILFVNASLQTPTGVLLGVCYWACPDLSVSAAPNPPGAWKSFLRPTPCVTIAPNPFAAPVEPPPPGPPPLLPPPPSPPITGAVTNPDQPNPDATQNP